MPVRRYRKPQIAAQRFRFIVPAEKATLLQDGNDLIDKAGELGGMAEVDVETQSPAVAVAGAADAGRDEAQFQLWSAMATLYASKPGDCRCALRSAASQTRS